MLRTIGVVIVLWYITHILSSSVESLDRALSATFDTLEASAIEARKQLE